MHTLLIQILMVGSLYLHKISLKECCAKIIQTNNIQISYPFLLAVDNISRYLCMPPCDVIIMNSTVLICVLALKILGTNVQNCECET
mmetsp:Transcript_4929/g.12384  ORF Transcript_4929/g.12384 Transcript_4929/m.12384 type:complete len:87 (-) Transcript_4929:5917-6177(-)